MTEEEIRQFAIDAFKRHRNKSEVKDAIASASKARVAALRKRSEGHENRPLHSEDVISLIDAALRKSEAFHSTLQSIQAEQIAELKAALVDLQKQTEGNRDIAHAAFASGVAALDEEIDKLQGIAQ
ncbi:MAG: hypothetical protein ABJM82_16905 [Shimia thalassica]|uniref:hypothetical protein n=1 Tax=Shimia thalassica TaxID=1715693 RepID=UPI00329752E7